jgi:hypothetical protein
MSVILSDEITEILNNPDTTKVLASVDEQGNPHVVVKKSLHGVDDGTIHLLEILEGSNSGRNLTAALWFDRRVAILLFSKEGRQIQIKGKPIKYHISGPLFLEHYVKLRERLGDVDLAGIWVIEPDEVIDESFAERKARDAEERPSFIHLDRIAKETIVGAAAA